MLCGELAAKDGDVRELLGELEQQAIYLGRRELHREPAQTVREDVWVNLLAVARDQGVTEFVDEAHSEKSACVDGLLRRLWVRVLRLVQLGEALGEPAAGGHIGEHHVPSEAEQQVA